MAIRYAVANGNWSSTATWDGGTLPASGDDVYANNFAVNINQSITVNSLKKISNASPVIAAGGSFTVTVAATVTITAGIAATDNVTNSSFLLAVDAGSNAVTINAPGGITAGASTGRVPVQIQSTHSGTVTVNANITGGTTTGAYFTIANSGITNITGNVTGGGGTIGLGITGDATVTMTGNVVGGNSGSGWGVWLSSTSASLTVNGNVTGGGSTSIYGVNQVGTSSSLTITGNVTGGSGTTAYGLNQTGGAATIRGSILFSASSVAAINALKVRLSGHIYCGGTDGTSTNNGAWPILGNFSFINGEDITIHAFGDGGYPSTIGGAQTTLTRYGSNNPAASDVRYGVVYGSGGANTGTLRVPPAASVAAGVLTDATTGTAALKLSDVLAGTGNQIAAVFP